MVQDVVHPPASETCGSCCIAVLSRIKAAVCGQVGGAHHGWPAALVVVSLPLSTSLCSVERFWIQRTIWGCSLGNSMGRAGEVTPAPWGLQHRQLLLATTIQTRRMQQGLCPRWQREKLPQPKAEIKRLAIRSNQLGKCIYEQNEKPITALFLLSCQ